MATTEQTFQLDQEEECSFSDLSRNLCELYHCVEEDTDKGYIILEVDSRFVAVQKRPSQDGDEVTFHVAETLGDAQALLEYGRPDTDLMIRIRAVSEFAGVPRWALEEDGYVNTHSSHDIATQLEQLAGDAERPPQD